MSPRGGELQQRMVRNAVANGRPGGDCKRAANPRHGNAYPGRIRHYNTNHITVDFAMTLTVKLDPQTEQSLRLRMAASGRSVSEIMREALLQWLAQTPAPPSGAYALGAELFGRHAGPENLSTDRKALLAQAWDAKRPPMPTPHLPAARKAKKD